MIKPEQIIDHVCNVLKLEKSLLISEKREQCPYCNCKPRVKVKAPEYVAARQIIILLIRRNLYKDYSYKTIAEMLGRTLANGKGDHVFALSYEMDAIRLLKENDKTFTEKYNKCKTIENKKAA